MRLIDADKITFFDCLAKTENSVCCHAKGIVSKDGIDAQPTVEAIPIEWIERYIKLHNLQLREDKRHGRGKIIEMQEWALFTLKGLLKDWEAENGRKNAG